MPLRLILFYLLCIKYIFNFGPVNLKKPNQKINKILTLTNVRT